MLHFLKETVKKKQRNLLKSLFCHWHLHNKMLRHVLRNKFSKCVQSRFITLQNSFTICLRLSSPNVLLYVFNIMQCFIQLCVIVEQSFSSSLRWEGAFTNSIHSCSKPKMFDQGCDFWEQIFLWLCQLMQSINNKCYPN